MSPVTETEPSLTEFLLARLSEDEYRARSAASDPLAALESGMWASAHEAREKGERDAEPLMWAAQRLADRIAAMRPRTLHDPARVLADVEAKRRIVELHPPQKRREWDECAVCFDPDTAPGDYDFEAWPCSTLQALAQPYAAHPEFRGEWAL